MKSLRILLGLVFGLTLAAAASGQASGQLRWRGGAHPLGLHLGTGEARGPCGSIAFPCEETTNTVRLYTSPKAPRSLDLQLGYTEEAQTLRMLRPQGLNVSVIGTADLFPSLGVYGRLGTTAARAGLAGTPGSEGGITYGIGLSWHFSRRGSAMVGWDSYDFRTLGGEARDVRATSLGLQWRY